MEVFGDGADLFNSSDHKRIIRDFITVFDYMTEKADILDKDYDHLGTSAGAILFHNIAVSSLLQLVIAYAVPKDKVLDDLYTDLTRELTLRQQEP